MKTVTNAVLIENNVSVHVRYVNRNATHGKSVPLLQESEPVGAQTGKSVSDVTNVQWHIAVDVEQS